MSNKRRDSLWLTVQAMIVMALGLVSTVLAARIYGPETMGYITFAVAYTSLFMPIVRLGLDGILIHELLQNPEQSSQILWTSVAMRGAAGALAITIIWSSLHAFESRAANESWMLIIAFSVFGMIGESFLGALQSQGYIKNGAIAKILSSLVTASLRVTVLLTEMPIGFFVATYALDALIMLGTMLATYILKAPFARPHGIRIGIAKHLLGRSWPLIASSMAVAIYGRIDQVMIGSITNSSREAGVYAAAATISELWYFIPGSIITVMQVQILAMKPDTEDFDREMVRLYSLVATICLGICCGLSASSWVAMRVLYGPAYTSTESVTSVAILTWAGFFALMGSARSPWIIGHNLQRYSMIYLVIGCAVNITLNAVAIPAFGIVGAAGATLVSQVVTAVIAPSVFIRTRQSVAQMVASLHPQKIAASFEVLVSIVKQRGPGSKGS